jgi:hypothetical protein
MYVPESVDSVMRTLSPRIAPPVTWLVGSTARTAALRPSFLSETDVLLISELFPAPAGPVIPIMTDLPDVLNIFLISFLAWDSSFSTIDIAFAMAPRFPFFRSANKFKQSDFFYLQ